MVNIIKKELNQYFKGMFGYFFGAVLLMFAGIYTVMVNCNMGYASFEYTLNNMSFMYLILIPILTMRSLSEEKKQRTDQLLFSLPVKLSEVVIGKYIAILAVLAVPVIITAAYPLILSRYGEVVLKTAYVNLVAFFLLGAALASIGLFVSSLTENQAIAAGLSFAVFLFAYFGSNLTDYLPGTAAASLAALIAAGVVIALILYILTGDITAAAWTVALCVAVLTFIYRRNHRIFEGLFSRVVGSLSLFERYYVFARGVLDLRSVVYFLSVIIFFLFITVHSLEKRRWS
ncbi:MAG: ABC transporter permease subunit [Lachnospiraceae bacterium]|nr:ABC transporter permease subunit [Lachnospiraceae bacterium]